MRCPSCGSRNPDGKRFCGDCASPLGTICPKCHAENPAGKKYCSDCGAALPDPTVALRSAEDAAAPLTVATAEPTGVPRGARRQVTVMFCDLVGSTALSERLDPEELRELMQAYQRACASAVASFEGYVAQYLGDGLLVYFGYPSAHEDDAARAVRSGIAIVERVRDLNTHLAHPLQVRIGIHTGLVVVGPMATTEHSEHLAIVGQTPNIAARLQEQAPPNGVVISAASRGLIAGLFECEDLGKRSLKGISSPLSVYRVIRESQDRSRFEVAVRTGLTPLVGRIHELGLLRERWERAKHAEGQVVLLSGEAGIGKSRLGQTLEEQARAQGATIIQFRSSTFYQNSAFYPFIDQLRRFLNFEPEDSPTARLVKLEQALSGYRFAEPETFPLLASLLSLPQPADAVPLTSDPQRQKQKTQAALVAWIVEEAEKSPVYCVWEDVHWADPSSLEALTLLLDQAPTARLLVLLTFRPDFRPPWPSRSHIAQLVLSRLGRQEVETMVQRITSGKSLPAEVIHEVVSRTDGVPLFVEELTRTVMESGLVRERDGRYELAAPQRSLDIPSSLNDSLMARLDRLGTAKEVAELGAVLGREFSYEQLRAVSSLDESILQRELNELVRAEILHPRGMLPQARYIFRHALIQDAAYQSLLKGRRQQYHRHIADTLAERFPETKEAQPELLAHHYSEAGAAVLASRFWLQAGRVAAQRSAHVEAIRHLTRGLDLLATLPDTPERAQQELALQMTIGTSMLATRGIGAPEAGTAYTRARELCRQLGEAPQLFPTLMGLRFFYTAHGELQEAREVAEQLLRMAQSKGDPALMLEAHYALAVPLHLLGEFAASREHFERAINLYDSRQRRILYGIGVDAAVASRAIFACVLWQLGYPDQALETSREALALAKQVNHPFSLAYALQFSSIIAVWRGEALAALEYAEDLVRLCQEQGFSSFLAGGIFVRGELLAAQGQEEKGIAEMLRGIDRWRATGARGYLTGYLAELLETYLRCGQTNEATKVISEALTLAADTGERYQEARLYRLKGDLICRINGGSEAEQSLRTAIQIARDQNARSWELQAATSLARSLAKQGRRDDARRALSATYSWFTEGFNTEDLKDAKELLDELKT